MRRRATRARSSSLARCRPRSRSRARSRRRFAAADGWLTCRGSRSWADPLPSTRWAPGGAGLSCLPTASVRLPTEIASRRERRCCAASLARACSRPRSSLSRRFSDSFRSRNRSRRAAARKSAVRWRSWAARRRAAWMAASRSSTARCWGGCRRCCCPCCRVSAIPGRWRPVTLAALGGSGGTVSRCLRVVGTKRVARGDSGWRGLNRLGRVVWRRSSRAFLRCHSCRVTSRRAAAVWARRSRRAAARAASTCLARAALRRCSSRASCSAEVRRCSLQRAARSSAACSARRRASWSCRFRWVCCSASLARCAADEFTAGMPGQREMWCPLQCSVQVGRRRLDAIAL